MCHVLPPDHYPLVKPLLPALNFNLIIAALLEQTSPGTIYVDDLANPRSCFLDTAEGSYLAGNPDNDAFNAGLKTLVFNTFFAEDEYIVLEVTDDKWASTLDVLFAERVFYYPRLYYTFTQPALEGESAPPAGMTLAQVDADFLTRTNLKNIEAVQAAIPSNWSSAEAFFKDGFGVCLVTDDTVVSWCMADCASDGRCEIGIHTDPRFQKRGLATITVQATVRQALSQGYSEIGWHCWQHNRASSKVAEKVGFQQQRTYGAYLCLANDLRHWLERGLFAARQGHHHEALGWYEKAATHRWSSILAARSYTQLGDHVQAFQSINQAIAAGWDSFDYLLNDEFEPLRALPEWQTLPLEH